MDDDLVETIRATRRRLAAQGPARGRSAGDFERVSIPSADGDALRDRLIANRANSLIEIGLAYGRSALAIAEALVTVESADARHVIIDAYQEGRIGTGVPQVVGSAALGVVIAVALCDPFGMWNANAQPQRPIPAEEYEAPIKTCLKPLPQKD